MKQYKTMYNLYEETGLCQYRGILYSALETNSKRDINYVVMSLRKLSSILDKYLYLTNLNYVIKSLSKVQEQLENYIRVLSSNPSIVLNTRTIENFIYNLLSCFGRLQEFCFDMHRMGF